MANKSTFIATVNAFLVSVVNILKHRNSMLEVINELWKPMVRDTNLTTNIITKTYPSAFYDLKFHKVGNKVDVEGRVRVSGISALPINSVLATFTNAEFKPKDSQIFFMNCLELGGNGRLTLSFTGGTTTGTIVNSHSMTLFSEYAVSGWYLTND